MAFNLVAPVPTELNEYLSKDDSSYQYQTSRDQGTQISLTSQTWQGNAWNHTILIREPKQILKKGLGVLFITGDGPRAGDRALLPLVTAATGLPTAFLFDIPNQPIYGLKEDDLIAYTFDKYLSTKDNSWPLLFPMTKSAIRAMDAIVDSTKNSSNPIKEFVVMGASKRGWTTWMTAASGDKRVKAIAPMVIDNLNVGKQMAQQIREWGAYSDQIEAYTKLGLQAKFFSKDGRHLSDMVDPYMYRSRINQPTLIVNGSNDPYWTVDASSNYWSDLKQPKWIVTVPNVGHDLGGGAKAVETVGAFCRSIAGKFKMPTVDWTLARSGRSVKVTLKYTGQLSKITVWRADSVNLDFRPSKYEAVATVTDFKNGRSELTFPLANTGNSAAFAEATFMDEGRSYRLCCPTQIFKSEAGS